MTEVETNLLPIPRCTRSRPEGLSDARTDELHVKTCGQIIQTNGHPEKFMHDREQDEAHEERFQQAIADQLGITAQELDEWVVSEDGEFTDDDVLVVHSVEFHKNTPSRILDRVGLPQKGTKVKHLKPIRADSLGDITPGPRSAEGIAPLRDSSVSEHKPPVFSNMMKWLFISLAVPVGAVAAAVAWILHSLGPMPSFG